MLFCEFGPDYLAFLAGRNARARRLAGELLVRLLVARLAADGTDPDGVVVSYVDRAASPKFTDFNEGRASIAEAADMIATLIDSGHGGGHLELDGHQYRIRFDAGEGLVTLWWPDADAWPNDRWQDAALDILQAARNAGAKLETNVDAIT